MARRVRREPHPTIQGTIRRAPANKKPVSKLAVPITPKPLRPITPPQGAAERNLEADIAALRADADLDKVEALTTVTAQELEDIKMARPKSMTREEKLAALEMAQRRYPLKVIAARVDRSPDTIKHFLADYKDTTALAKARLAGGAERLAHRIIEHADVQQSIDVLERLGAVPAAKKDAESTAQKFQVIVGVVAGGSGQASNPIPTQEAVEAEFSKTSE